MQSTPSAVQGPARIRLEARQIARYQASVVVDGRRRRPLYFDGRFLAARDLVREQSYFLTRQADLGRAGGFGVVDGLHLHGGAGSTTLTIGAGHGITPGGELVVVPRDFAVDLVDVPEIQRLNAAFGLLERPTESPRSRSGLFVLALRPVEWSADPTASYPTSLAGPRSVEDGEIVEGAAVTLIPYPDAGPELTSGLRRARVAHDVFVGGSGRGTAAGALPLALVSLNLGTVEWLDVFMVRREVGAEHGDVVGLGFAPRALREAHLLQYEGHLREVLLSRQGKRFAATEHFMALPPAGRLPASAVDPRDFSQIFFPSTVDVDLSIIPEDEIPALVEESMTLPPIDLTRSADELDSTSVVIVIPIPRDELRTISSDVSTLSRSLKPAAPGMLARRSPLEHLQAVRLPGNFVPLPAPTRAEDEAWVQLLGRAPMLWYIRRRTLHQRADLAGERELLTALQKPTTDHRKLAAQQAELDALRHELKGREAELAERERAVTAREQTTTRLETTVAAQSREATAAVAAREADVNRREAAVKKLESELNAREASLGPQSAEAKEREAQLRTRQEALLAREAEFKRREDAVARREIASTNESTDLRNRLSVVATRESMVTQQEASVRQLEAATLKLQTTTQQRGEELDRRALQLSTGERQLQVELAQVRTQAASTVQAAPVASAPIRTTTVGRLVK